MNWSACVKARARYALNTEVVCFSLAPPEVRCQVQRQLGKITSLGRPCHKALTHL